MLQLTIITIIKIYQKTISFDHGPMRNIFPFLGCRFHPSCSQYAIQAISKYGTLKGGYLSIKRIFRCNPFSRGGHDPVP